MGKCSSLIRSFKNEDEKGLIQKSEEREEKTNMMQKIELINSWQSYQLETVIEKIMAMCEYEKKNHMNFTLFLEFFASLKPMSMKTQLRYFDLFDFTSSSYINIREIIFGISQIYWTPQLEFSQVLKEVYKRGKGDTLSYGQIKLFLNQNKVLLSTGWENDKNFKKCISNKEPIAELDFDMFIAKFFDIRKYQQWFDFYDTQLQITILQDLKKRHHKVDENKIQEIIKIQQIQIINNKAKQDKKLETYQIKIMKNDRVYVIQTSWFQTWVKYMYIHGCERITYQVEGQSEIKNFSNDQIIVENRKLIRPPKIFNYDLLDEYQTDLREGTKLFEDFIVIPEKMYKKLALVYKGGPEIARVYPFVFETIVVNKVFIDNKGKFIENKTVRCTLRQNQSLFQLFQIQSKKGSIFFKYVPKQSDKRIENDRKFQWTQLVPHTITKSSHHQGFICFIEDSLKISFQTNYKDNTLYTNDNYYSYGQILNFMTYSYYDQQYDYMRKQQSSKKQYKYNLAYITDMKKSQVKVHFVGCSDTCDDYYSIQELKKAVQTKASRNAHVVQNKNIITGFSGLSNCTYIDAVLQVLIASPYFSDYFLKQKHIRSLSSTTNLQSCLSSHFSKLIYYVKKSHKQTAKPDDLYKKLASKFDYIDFNTYNKQYVDKFLSNFLQTLSQQLGNPQKLFDKYPLVQMFEQKKQDIEQKNQFKGSIIEAFFKLSQSTKSICSTCKAESIHTQYSYTLKMPLPQDEQVCYNIIFFPVNSKRFTKYAITIRKSQRFIKYVDQFAKLINIDSSRICFAQIKHNQFRKHYTQYDYQSSLLNLDLNPEDDICAFELKNPKYNRQLQNEDESTYYDKFLRLKQGMYVDFNLYTQWHVGKVISFNKDKVFIENFEGQSEVQKKRVDNFKQKTEQKQWYQIDLLHRRINEEKQYRIEYFMKPSIISIAQWMSWQTVFDMVKDHVKNYFDLNNGESNNLLQKLLEFLDNFPQEQFERTTVNGEKNHDDSIFVVNDIKDQISSKTVSTKVQMPIFKINFFLTNSGQICAICSKKSIFKKKIRKQDEKYCYGHKHDLNSQQPMAIRVNPAKISIVLDWTPKRVDSLDIKFQQKTFQDPTYNFVKTRIRNQLNTIYDCLQLYIQTNKKIQIDCQKCGRTMGQQTRYLSQCPNLLAIHLNRFKIQKNMQTKLKNKIQLVRQLTIQKIQMQSKKQDIYELYAVICHREQQGQYKWYSCILKNKNVWVKCQDRHTTLIDFNKIYKEDIYMAFYRKKNIKCTILSMIF